MLENLKIIIDFWLPMLIVSVTAYFIGCLNSALVVTKMLSPDKNDIRKLGSGNAGFSNALRSLNKKSAILIFIGDFAKGVLAVWLSSVIVSLFPLLASNKLAFQNAAYLASLMCVVGHIYPCFFGFKGGKGILTAWATTLLIDWRVFLAVITVFLIFLVCTKIMSLSSIAAAVVFPFASFTSAYFNIAKNMSTAIFALVMCLASSVIIIISHKSNILRIVKGTERKLGEK